MLRSVVLVGGLGLAVVVAIAPALRGRVACSGRDRGASSLGLAAPAAYTLSTVAHPHSGSIPTAGPASAGGRTRRLRRRRAAAARPSRGASGRRRRRFAPAAAFPGGPAAFGNRRRRAFRAADGDRRDRARGGAGGGGVGGLLNGSTPSAAITTLFEQSTGYRWTAAAIGANNAAGYQLASGKAVMAIGGFNGTDPTPTLAQFEQYVKAGEIHYFIASRVAAAAPGGGGRRARRARSPSGSSSNFTAQTVGGTTIYDLSSAGQ